MTNPFHSRCLAAWAGFVLLHLTEALPCHAFNTNGFWSSTATDASTQLGMPTTLTWSIVPDGTTIQNVIAGLSRSSDLISDFDAILGGDIGSDLTQRPWFAPIQASFDRWEAVSGVDFVYEPNDDGADMGPNNGLLGVRGDIRIGGAFIDGVGGTLAQAGFVPSADITLDTSEILHFGNTADDSLTLRNTLTHEIGHSLGLAHNESFNTQILMEPNFNPAYDGPQFDDILGVHFQYGDPQERQSPGGNGTPASATPLGTIADGQSVTVGSDGRPAGLALDPLPTSATDFLSISNLQDIDFFRFSIDQPSTVEVTLSPVGKIYSQSPTGLAPFTSVIGTQQNNLRVQLLEADGVSLLGTAASGGLGVAETLSEITLAEAGEYVILVAGSSNNTQLYELAVAVTATPPPVLAGDFNNDGVVDGADYATWRNALEGGNDLPNAPASPGVVDIEDLATWKANFGSPPPPAAASAVPEPGAAMVGACATFFISLRVCRRALR